MTPNAWGEGFTADEVVPFAVWSASLPLGWVPAIPVGSGRWQPWGLAPDVVRPWNGRPLTPREVDGCFRAFIQEYDRTCGVGLAVQAAYEFLSGSCP